jgi:hypothetical protein
VIGVNEIDTALISVNYEKILITSTSLPELKIKDVIRIEQYIKTSANLS